MGEWGPPRWLATTSGCSDRVAKTKKKKAIRKICFSTNETGDSWNEEGYWTAHRSRGWCTWASHRAPRPWLSPAVYRSKRTCSTARSGRRKSLRQMKDRGTNWGFLNRQSQFITCKAAVQWMLGRKRWQWLSQCGSSHVPNNTWTPIVQVI